MSEGEPRVPSAWQLERAVSAWQQLRAHYANDPGLEDDEAAISAALADAEITHPEVLLERAIDAVMWAGLREVEADEMRRAMTARRDRYRARGEIIREIIGQLLQALDMKSRRARFASASLALGPPSVVILDEQLLPDALCRIERTPNKTLIRERIEQGEDVPGAAMSNPAPVLRIRRL